MADKGSDSGEEEDPTIAEDVVVTKYKMAGDMANRKFKKLSGFFVFHEKWIHANLRWGNPFIGGLLLNHGS